MPGPGFVPRLQAGAYPCGFKWVTEAKALRKARRFEIAVPLGFVTRMRLLCLLPYRLYFPPVGRLTGGRGQPEPGPPPGPIRRPEAEPNP